jgi:hypothetical protein
MKFKTAAMSLLAVLAGTISVWAQTNTPITVKGTLDIKFDTRTKDGPRDRYALNVNVCDSAVFRGLIWYKPFVAATIHDTLGSLDYDVSLDVVNPHNTSQTVNVGKLNGSVPVDGKNVYRFSDGDLRMSVLPRGVAKGFESKFGGLALGKPPQNSGSLLSRAKQEAMKFAKTVKGKAVGIVVSNYDKMEFQNHVLASGPVQVYPEVTVNGNLVYDYARSAWYLNGVTCVYALDGRQLADKLTGTIRWVEAQNRKTSGEGQYEFDVRINEPVATENAVFAGPQDENAFFETDTSVSALTGTVKYKDTMSGDSVVASSVKIDLVGNKMTKQQAMYLTKLILVSSIVPFNAE